MAIAIVEELWGRIRAHIDDKITAATAASESAVAAKTAAEAAATTATTAVAAEVEKLKGEAPEAFDTLGEIAAELAANETERSALTNSIAAKADKTYVDSETARVAEVTNSRGQQTVVNGNGQLGGAYWSGSLTFVPTDAPSGTYGSWERPETQSTIWNDHDIVIDPTLPTYMSAYVRQAKVGGSGSVYLTLAPVDQDGNSVSAVNIMYLSGTLTTLAQDLKAGDTAVHLTSSENWGRVDSPQSRRFIFWNHVSDSGKEWGPETYSRNVTYADTWLSGGVDHEANTITLAAPWSGDTVPAGTPLSNGNNGANYMYARSGTVSSESWEKREGTVAGKQDLTGRGFSPERGWPPGVSAVRPGVLLNLGSNSSNSNVRFANVYVSQLAPLGHTHTIADVTGLEDALTAAGTAEHTHPQSEVDGLEAALDGKASANHTHTASDVGAAPVSHTHTVSQVTGLQSALDGKAAADHQHDWDDVAGKPTVYPPETHTHTAAQISDATTTGRNVLKASSQSAARSAIGAGTSNLALGTTSSTAAAGNHTHTASDVGAAPTSHTHTKSQITDLETISTTATVNHVVKRTTSGNITVPTTPNASSSAASKSYVDGRTPEVRVVSSLPASPSAGVVYVVTG